jgi:6 kDa early secretory antigenic target
MIVTDLKVNHGGLDLAAADLRAAGQELQRIVEQLESRLNSRQESWTGSAKDAYVPAKAQWNSAIHGMQELLLQLGQAVDNSNLAFAAADQSSGRRFG